MQFLDYCILAVILVLAFFAVRYSIKHKGKCCGNCSGCSGCSGCKVACEKIKPDHKYNNDDALKTPR